jgi:nucleotide-binding universal stress UspA family protein
MRILLAIDGSPCSETAVQSVAQRRWPAPTQIEVVTVVFTHMPTIPDPTLTGIAMHWTAIEDARRRAPILIEDAQSQLRGRTDVEVTSMILEGHPADVIIEEARRWNADLIVVGSHGYGPVKRLALGSVSGRIATHAPCSVEIVRCPHDAET